MRLTVHKKLLQDNLKDVASLVTSKAPLSYLYNLLLRARNGFLEIMATNLDFTVQSRTHAIIEEEGEALIDAKVFAKMVKGWPHEEITIEKQGETLVISTKSFSVTCASEPTEEYPLIVMDTLKSTDKEDINIEITEPSISLGEMLTKTSFATSTDVTKPMLNGVFFEAAGEEIKMIATDGTRLAYCSHKAPEVDKIGTIIIPSEACKYLIKIANNKRRLLKITFNKKQALFEFNDVSLLTRLIEENYVNYAGVIPKNSDKTLCLDKEYLVRTLRNMSLVEQVMPCLKMHLSQDIINLSMESPESNTNIKQQIEAQYEGEEIVIKCHPKLLLEGIKHMKGEVTFRFKDNVTAIIIRPSVQQENEEYFYLLMPQRPDF